MIDNGGIAFVTSPDIAYMAKAAKDELEKRGVRKIELHSIEFVRFPCSEVKPRIVKNVRQKDVYLFYNFTVGAFNDDLWCLNLTLDALHFAGVNSITLVTPFLPYLRQDRKDEPRVPISAARMIRSLELTPSLKRVITVDMHADQLQAVFTIPTDHLPGRIVMAPWVKKRFAYQIDNVVAVAPDFGSAKRVRKLAQMINPNMGVSILEKNRDSNGVEILSTIGANVKGKTCLINDDMMDTCGTIIKASDALYQQGAKEVILTATHPVFSPKEGSTAYEKLANANVEVVVTDSLWTENHDWLEVLPLAKYMALTILQHVTKNGSVSKLIEEGIDND